MKKMFLLSIIFAILATISAYSYLSNIKNKYEFMSDPVKVIVANKTIAQGALIKRENLSEIEVPKKYKQPKSFDAIEKLLSKEGKASFIALSPIEEGEQIIPSKVSDTNKETGIVHIIPDGYKAIALDFGGNSKILKPGNRIDIFSIIEYEDENKRHQESIFVTAQNILVLSVGDNYLGSFTRPKNQNQDGEDRNVFITLATSDEEAQKILLAGDKGSLKFIIRPVGDNGDINIKPLKMSDLSGGISKPISAAQKESDKTKNEVLEIINRYSQR